VFAGPFRGYGLVLILEQGGGYHWLIAGLGRLDVVPGQTVAAGEPIGLVGSKDGDDAPTVYLELRRNGQPIDPMPWLAASNGKVSG
jgi:septal ring factor EnvC (AmiA/AmiB activator)